MNILIAPNAFKNSLDAHSVSEAIALGLQKSKLDCRCQLFPVADGGDGTGSLIIKHLNGALTAVSVHDALGRQITGAFGLIDDGRTAVIEMADASGIRLLKTTELNPMLVSTFGTGELIKAALDKGATKIILGMGGSATVDGGMGILNALGVAFLDRDGKTLNPIPVELINIAAIDTSNLDTRIPGCEIIILCDVDNKLLGPEGAAAVFGPQKGATPIGIKNLDGMLARFAAITLQQTGRDITIIKHSGAAGGAAAGLYAFLNAKLVSGANRFLELTNFNATLQNADLVITGEGSIDEQTLQGKAPVAVAAAAKKKGIKVIGIAGKIPAERSEGLGQYFDQLITINPKPVDLATALKNTRTNLIETAKEIGSQLT